LEPGQKETWTAVVSGPKAAKTAAEFVAGLYDASLDAYLPHAWLHKFNVFRHDSSTLGVSFQNGPRWLNHLAGQFTWDYKGAKRVPGRRGRDGERPDGPAEPAAVPPRRGRARVHGEGDEPVDPAPTGIGSAHVHGRPDQQAARR